MKAFEACASEGEEIEEIEILDKKGKWPDLKFGPVRNVSYSDLRLMNLTCIKSLKSRQQSDTGRQAELVEAFLSP